MLRNFIAFLILVGAVSNASAALVWKDGLSIKSVEYSWNGTKETITVAINESLATGCSATDTKRQFAYVETFNEAFKIRYSALITAMTSNKKVSILYETAVCDPVYGARLEGIRIVN